jgi:hypothetical protein
MMKFTWYDHNFMTQYLTYDLDPILGDFQDEFDLIKALHEIYWFGVYLFCV